MDFGSWIQLPNVLHRPCWKCHHHCSNCFGASPFMALHKMLFSFAWASNHHLGTCEGGSSNISPYCGILSRRSHTVPCHDLSVFEGPGVSKSTDAFFMDFSPDAGLLLQSRNLIARAFVSSRYYDRLSWSTKAAIMSSIVSPWAESLTAWTSWKV